MEKIIMHPVICAIIPAHNEQDNIESAIKDLLAQTYKLHRIIVVDDFSSDNTSAIVERLMISYPERIILLKTANPELRAGALNKGLQYIQENIKNCKFLLSADADTRFDRNLVLEGIKSFKKNKNIGGVCSIAGLLNPVFYKEDGVLSNIEKWILWRFQKLEYGGFDSTRTATWTRVLILHGLCSMFRFNAVIEVGGYQPNHLLEDYKLTLQLKKSGWKTIFNPRMIAETDPVSNIKRLVKQRVRWMRGGIDIILEEGINKYTFEDAFNHLIFLSLLITILAIVILQSTQYGWYFQLNLTPLPIILAIGGYLISLYNLKFVRRLDAIDIIIRVLILPELLLSIFYSWLQIWAYISAILKLKEIW